jgi:hypothetical protein
VSNVYFTGRRDTPGRIAFEPEVDKISALVDPDTRAVAVPALSEKTEPGLPVYIPEGLIYRQHGVPSAGVVADGVPLTVRPRDHNRCS